jgi:NitT/TauT family transport system substrate-binding protein
MMVYDFPPFGVYALKKSGIKVPKDLEGKKLGAPVFDASFKLFPAFAAVTKVDNSKVTQVNLTPQLREISVVIGDVDFFSGHYFSSMIDLKAKGAAESDIVVMRYSDFGLDFYGNAVIASPEMLKYPAAIKGFVRATIKAVMMAYDFPPFGVYALKKSGIKVPKDLEGKKLGAPVFDASFKLFPAFAAVTKVDNSKVTKVNLTPQLREISLVKGDVDFISGHYFSSMIDLKAKGAAESDIVVMRYSDFGLDFYGNAVIASPEMLKNPAAIKGFVRATIKAWKEVIADPKMGVAIAKKKDPLIDEAIELERLNMSLRDNVVTPYVKANGMGNVDPARLDRAMAQLAQALGLKVTPKGSDVFTPEFLPPKAKTMVTK